MKIIILGAGQVGYSVAASLANESNDITVIDCNARLLNYLQSHYDLQVVNGHGAHPDVLQQAGADEADLLLAVTNSDETNMLACQIAHTLFKIPTRIARVRETDYLKYPALFAPEALAVTDPISPETLVTHNIHRLIEHPEALQVVDFAKGAVQLVVVKAYYGGILLGRELKHIQKLNPNLHSRIVAIYRRGRVITPTGHYVLEANDEVFFISPSQEVNGMLAMLRPLSKPIKRVIIGGGGNIGKRLAQRLEHDYRVKVIELNAERAINIASVLSSTTVLSGDIADESLLQEANIGATDIFCALTNNDQVNILSAMLAKQLGAKKVMALVNREAYVNLVESSHIDIVISPQEVTIGSLLARVRRGDVVRVHALRRGRSEALEAIAHGDANSSKVVGRCIADIPLPKGASIGAIVRNDKTIMAHHDTVIVAEDHVILFLAEKSDVQAIEALFQVGFIFF